MPLHYPFSAVLGCEADALDDMGLALVLATISPEIGGVLVRGEKGTAKSTTVRALAAVLPPIEVYAVDRFSVDPADPAPTSPDGPFGADAEVTVRPVRLVELPPESRAPVLMSYLGRAVGARPHIPVDPNGPIEAFEGIARSYPVFRIDTGSSAGPT